MYGTKKEVKERNYAVYNLSKIDVLSGRFSLGREETPGKNTDEEKRQEISHSQGQENAAAKL